MINKYKKSYCILRNKQQWNIPSDHPMYCCPSWINNYINDPRVPISYNPWRRFYYLVGLKNTMWVQVLSHCLICFKKFSKDLITIREKILKKEYKITEFPMELTNKKFTKLGILDKFFTKKWWRKRGL